MNGKSEVYEEGWDEWGQSYPINWNGAYVEMHYEITNGTTTITDQINLNYWKFQNNNNFFGQDANSPVEIDLSTLPSGIYSVKVWFKIPNQDIYDSNNGSNYVATFTKVNPTISISDNSTGTEVNTTLNNYLGYYVDLTLSGRTLKGNQWNTICLPFDLAVSGSIFTDVKTLQSSLYNNGTLTLNFSENSETTIVAGKPYLVKVNSDIANPTFTDVAISTTTPGQVGSESATFKGTFNPIEYTEENTSILYLGAGNNLYYPSPTNGSSVTINSFRAYFELGEGITAGEPLPGQQGIKSFVLNFGDDNEETSIKQINNTESATDTYFTLDGRRLNDKPATAGLYIINGKKVVIK